MDTQSPIDKPQYPVSAEEFFTLPPHTTTVSPVPIPQTVVPIQPRYEVPFHHHNTVYPPPPTQPFAQIPQPVYAPPPQPQFALPEVYQNNPPNVIMANGTNGPQLVTNGGQFYTHQQPPEFVNAGHHQQDMFKRGLDFVVCFLLAYSLSKKSTAPQPFYL